MKSTKLYRIDAIVWAQKLIKKGKLRFTIKDLNNDKEMQAFDNVKYIATAKKHELIKKTGQKHERILVREGKSAGIRNTRTSVIWEICPTAVNRYA